MIEKSLDRIAATGIAMEMNTSGFSSPIQQMYPGYEILEMMKQRGIPIVLGSDAHQPEFVASFFEPALEMLVEVGYSTISSFEKRQRCEINISEAQSRLEEAIVSAV